MCHFYFLGGEKAGPIEPTGVVTTVHKFETAQSFHTCYVFCFTNTA